MPSIDSRRSARQQAREDAAARERAQSRARAEQAAREVQARRAAQREVVRREALELARQLDEAAAARQRLLERLREALARTRALERREARRRESKAPAQKADKTTDVVRAAPDRPSSRFPAPIPARNGKPEVKRSSPPSDRPARIDTRPPERSPIAARGPDKSARGDRAQGQDSGRPQVAAAHPDAGKAREPARSSVRAEAARAETKTARRRDDRSREKARPERFAASARPDIRALTSDRERPAREAASAGSATPRPDFARPTPARRDTPASVRAEPSPGPTRGVLESRLSSGVLSGALPWLVTRGARLMTVDGDTLVLHGVNAQSFGTVLPGWPLNIVRVVVTPDLPTADAMMTTADAAIARNAAHGAYTLFALRLTASAVADPADDPLTLLANRYVDEPAVLFALAPPSGVANERGLLLLQNALARLRAVHPRSLAMIEGESLIEDAPAWPVRNFDGDGPIPNLVYGAPLVANGLGRLLMLARHLPMVLPDWPPPGAGLRAEAVLGSLGSAAIGWTAALPASGSWRDANADTRTVQRALSLAAIWDATLPRAA